VERSQTFEFTASRWRYLGEGSWHFVSLPPEIAELTTGIRAGFGSLRVAVTVGATSQRTSIFPDSKTWTYGPPVKKQVRAADKLGTGDNARARIQIVDL
jgi:hypothetical protein